MSLINKMLHDLEKRDAFIKEDSDQVLDGLYSAYDVELKNKKKANKLFILFLFFFSVIVILFFSYNFHSSKTSKIQAVKEIKTQENVKYGNKNIENNVFSKNKTYQSLRLDEELFIKKGLELSNTKKNYIDSIQFEEGNSSINLIIKMPEEIDYLVYGLTNPSRTVIEVENAELGFRLEELEPVDPIVAIRYSINDESKFKLVLESNIPLAIKKSITSQNETDHSLVVMMEHEWQEKEFYTEDSTELEAKVEEQIAYEKESVVKGDIIKIPVSHDTDAYAEKLFQEAYVDYKKGNISDSLKKLNMSLNQDAGHVKARSTLALILSEKNHLELAYSVLNEGLIQFPANIEWTKMYARLLLKEGKYVEAHAVLAKQQPGLILNSEYYALHAAVLQKLAEYEKAAKIYRNLLHVNPDKGVWWLGLGISLESLKRYEDALYAYQKATNNSPNAIDTRQFLVQRINRLNNILEDESS